MALDSFNRPSGHINWTPLVTALQNLANSGGSSGGSSTVVRNTASANSATEAYSTEYLNGKITALETSDGTQNTAISALQTSDSNQNTKLDKFPLGQSPADDNKQLAWVSNSYQLVSPSSTTILNPTDPGNHPAGSPNEVYSTAYLNIVTNQVVANATNINTLTNNQPGGLLVSTNPTATQISLVHANGAGVGVPVDLFSLNNAQTKDLLEYNAGNWVNSRAIQIDSVSAEQVTVRSADGSASFDFRQGTHGGLGNPGFVYSLPAINTLPPVGSVLQVGYLPNTTEAQLTWSTLSSGSSTFASLSDTAQYTSGDANKFVVLDNDGNSLVYTDKIKLNGDNIEVYGQLNAGSQPVNGVGGVAIGDSTHKFTQIHVTTVNSTTVNSTSVTATGTVQADIVEGLSYMQTPRIDTEQITVGNYTYILPNLTNAPTVGDVMKVSSVSNQVVTLALSGIQSWTDLDVSTMSNTTSNSLTNKNGVCHGNRWKANMFIENLGFFPALLDAHDWRQYFNGFLGGSGHNNNPFLGDDGDYRGWSNQRYLDYYSPSNYRYNFTGVRLYWSVPSAILAGGGLKAWGTNDNLVWTQLMDKDFSQATVGSIMSSSNVQPGVTYVSNSMYPHSFTFTTNTGYYKKYRLQWTDGTSTDSFSTWNLSGVITGDFNQYSLYEIEFF